MATRKIVPRADNEGGIGTALKQWASGWIKLLTVTTINALTLAAAAVGFTVAGGTSSKTLTVEGDSVIGSDLSPDAGPTFDHLHLTSGQIGFPATQSPSSDPNTLDDYEEGTWTIGVSFGGVTTDITYGPQAGFYTKNGNVVTVSGYLALTNKGSASGPAKITGLPYTVANNDAAYTSCSVMFNKVSFANQYAALTQTNTTTIALYENTEAGVQTPLTDVDFQNTSQLFPHLTYKVA